MINISTEVVKIGKIYKKINNNTSQIFHPETEFSQIVDFPETYGNTGKYLSTDGSGLVWTTVDALPSQTGNSGKVLTTNGTTASWQNMDGLPSQTGNSGKFLTTDGSTASWATVDALPSQANNTGKVLVTDGTDTSWVSLNSAQEVFNVTSSTTSVTLTSVPNSATASSIAVYHDGLRLVDGIDYNYVPSTKVINFNNSFLDGDQVVVYVGPIDFGTGATEGGSVDGLPNQVGNSGKFLTTNGVTTSWGTPTDTVTTATTVGTGNAVTSITATNGALTVTKGDSFVDLSTNQTISGVKTFEDNVYTKDVFIVKDDRIQATRPVSTFDGNAHYAQPFQYRGSDDKILSMIYTPFTRASASNWSNSIQLLVYNVTQENEFARIGVGYNQSGVYTIAPTPTTGDNSTQIATTAYVKANLNNYATKASPTFTGTPKAPTAAAGTNTTQIATTAFVRTAISNLVNSAPTTLDTLNELAAALGNDPNFATTVSTQIGEKLDADSSDYVKDLAISGTTLTVTKGDNTTETLTTYTLPEATTSTLGGVIVGSGLSVNNGTISANDQLPAQTNNSGKFLTTNGTTTSWSTVDALPSQTGNSGKYLTTDGTTAVWSNLPATESGTTLPSQTNNAGKFLMTDGTDLAWSDILNEIKLSSIHYPSVNATTITLTQAQAIPITISKYAMSVYRDGIYLNPSIDYGYNTSTRTLTFVKPFKADEVVSVLFTYVSTDTQALLNLEVEEYEAGNGITFTNNAVTNKTTISAVDQLPSQTNNSGKFLTTNGSTLSWAEVDALPTQTNNTGKFLTTNGTTASWETIPNTTYTQGTGITISGTTISAIDQLPSRTGNSGKFLTTDGTDVSWATVDTLPSQTNNSGKFLTTNGSSASWSTVEALPSQTNNSGKFLTTNGTTASWEALTNIDVVVNPTASSTTISLSEYSNYVNSDGSNILVFRDGFKQIADMDYTFSNNTLTFELAFVSNETVSVLISSAIGVIIDGEQVSY